MVFLEFTPKGANKRAKLRAPTSKLIIIEKELTTIAIEFDSPEGKRPKSVYLITESLCSGVEYDVFCMRTCLTGYVVYPTRGI